MQGRQALSALTGLRFFAAAAIVLHHVNGQVWVQKEWVAGWSLSHGVTLFFVLSGFILTYQYRATERGASIDFLAARFARILPSHLVMLAVVLGLRGYGGDPLTLALNVTLLQSWAPDLSVFFSYNDVSWSLSTEMGFYAIFPFLIGRVDRLWPVYVGAALIAGLGMAWATHVLALPLMGESGVSWAGLGLTMTNPIARMFEFTLGMAAASLFARRGTLRLPVPWATTLEGLAVLLLLFNITVGIKLVAPYLPNWGDSAGFWFWNSLVPGLPCAALIFVLARGEGLVSQFLAWRPVQYLGAISFALYLVHPTAIGFAQRFGNGPEAFALFLALALAGSVLLHEAVERPAQRFLRGRLLWRSPHQRQVPAE